jgi:hypothetical protein
MRIYKDPKLGYHWLWITPLLILITPFRWAKEQLFLYHSRKKKSRILNTNPKIKELAILAGTHKREKQND